MGEDTALESARQSCLLCGVGDGEIVLDLGSQPSVRHWPLPEDPTPDPTHGLALRLCRACGLAQLDADSTTEPEVPVPEPQAAIDQARQAVADLTRMGHLAGRSTVVEFSSPHGGSWLPHLPLKPVTTGADLLVDSLGLMHERKLPAALRARARALAPGGLAVFLIQPLGDIVEQRQWNVVRHGHYAYFSLTTLRSSLATIGLRPITALRYQLYGGVAVVLATRDGSPDARLRAIYRHERRRGLDTRKGLEELSYAVTASVGQLRRYLAECRAAGTRLYAYGAASRAVAELAMVGQDAGAIRAIGDASPAKQGRCMPGSRVPVISPDQLVAERPDEVLVLLPDLEAELLTTYPQLAGRLRVPDRDGVPRLSADLATLPTAPGRNGAAR